MTIKRVIGAAAFASLLGGGAQAQTLETAAASRQMRSERSLAVNVRFGMGDFTMNRDQGSALYRANIVYDSERFDPVLEYSDGRLEVGVDTDGDRIRNLRGIRGQRIDLSVSPRVPLRLNFEFGAGKADIDLGGLAIERVEVETGASESNIRFSRPTTRPCERFDVEMGAAQLVIEGLGNSNCAEIDVQGAAGSLTLDFTGEWQHEGVTNAKIALGLGDLSLRFPTNLGVSIELERFLASFDQDGFVRRGDRFVSTNYDSASAKLDIELRAIVGDVEVEWVPGR